MSVDKLGLNNISQALNKDVQTHKPEIGGDGFKSILDGALKGQEIGKKANLETSKLQFSNHAIDRIRSRGLHFDQEMLGKVEKAVEKAEAKGAKETLVLTDNSALIVNIANKTVVTAMDMAALKENVFTNIDSTVFV